MIGWILFLGRKGQYSEKWHLANDREEINRRYPAGRRRTSTCSSRDVPNPFYRPPTVTVTPENKVKEIMVCVERKKIELRPQELIFLYFYGGYKEINCRNIGENGGAPPKCLPPTHSSGGPATRLDIVLTVCWKRETKIFSDPTSLFPQLFLFYLIFSSCICAASCIPA